MSKQGDAAIDIGQAEHGIDYPSQFAHEEPGRAIDARDVARHGRWIAAVSFEIEGDRDIARLRQCQRIGLHELARPGKAVRNDYRGSLRTYGAPIHRRRRCSDRKRFDGKAGALVFELPNSSADAHNANDCRHPSGPGLAHNSPIL